MEIKFFEDPLQGPKPRVEVRFNQLGLYIHPGGRQVAVGFDITPFLERPSIEVQVVNEQGEPAGSLHVIEALQPNFHLTMHLRDSQPTQLYHLKAIIYYADLEGSNAQGRQVVDTIEKRFDATVEGEQ